MNLRALPLLLVLVAAFAWIPPAGALRAADLGVASPPTTTTSAGLKTALLRHAALLLLRESFDVVLPQDVPGLMDQAADAYRSLGDAAALSQDDEALLAEGSYYIVSLKYLIEFGGANWPVDRTQSAYATDSLQRLAALQDRWIQAVQSGADVLPILRQVDIINARTEGQTTVANDLDHYAGAEALVDNALKNLKEKSAPVGL